ncbi:MAG: hypothetical protein Q4E63_03830 [Prevotellaceae bacterium]|nr:hypothetical protein [Prevotellaceae bacterium]
MKLPPSEFVKFFPMKYGLDFLTSSALYFSSSQEFNDPFEFLPQMKNANDFRNMVCNINKEMYYINTKDKHIKERNKENSFSFSAPFLGGAAFMLTKSPLTFNPVVLSVLAESFNAKVKHFRAQLRGIIDKKFFLFRLTRLYA